jgi:hypothetical protein
MSEDMSEAEPRDIAAGADTTPIRGVEFVPLAKSRAEAAIYLLILTASWSADRASHRPHQAPFA